MREHFKSADIGYCHMHQAIVRRAFIVGAASLTIVGIRSRCCLMQNRFGRRNGGFVAWRQACFAGSDLNRCGRILHIGRFGSQHLDRVHVVDDWRKQKRQSQKNMADNQHWLSKMHGRNIAQSGCRISRGGPVSGCLRDTENEAELISRARVTWRLKLHPCRSARMSLIIGFSQGF